MKRYANDKYYYWRDALTDPKQRTANKETETADDRDRLHWLFPLLR